MFRASGPNKLQFCKLLPVQSKRASTISLAIESNETGARFAGEADGTAYSSPPAYPLYQAPQYQQVAPVAPVAPPPVPQEKSGVPFWVWLLVGAGVHWLWSKYQELRKNPAAMLAGMMGNMQRGQPGGGGDMAAMMEMMKQMQSQGGGMGQPASPFGGMPHTGTTIPTTASEVTPSTRDGSKFEQQKNASQPAAPVAQETAAASTTAASPTPPTSTSTSPPASGFFADTSSPSQKAAPQPSSFFSDTSSTSSPSSTVAGNGQGGEATEKLIDNMLKMVVDSPELQKQMNSFLPENMRGESTWKWIASSPDLRKQIASQMAPNFNASTMADFAAQPQPPGTPSPGGVTPDMGAVDVDQAMEQMKAQGVDPSNYMSEMMQDKEIMDLFMKPHVTEALMEIQKNPQSAVNYMSDPDVSKLMTKMMAIQAKMGGGSGMPEMPNLGSMGGAVPGSAGTPQAAVPQPTPVPASGSQGTDSKKA